MSGTTPRRSGPGGGALTRLTVVNETPGFWGVIAWYQSIGIQIPKARWGMGLGHAIDV